MKEDKGENQSCPVLSEGGRSDLSGHIPDPAYPRYTGKTAFSSKTPGNPCIWKAILT